MIKLFPEIEDDSLKEYSGDSAHEMYKGIVLDKKNNSFKVITGMFRDKKEFYEKMKKENMVLRKVFEKNIYDWIINNAKSTFDSYCMMSTAFSKWKGNNILGDYYVKLLNDIPQLNREKQKGNPNSRTSNVSVREASMAEQQFYTGPELDTDYTEKRKLTIYPVGLSGERDPKYISKPFIYNGNFFISENPKKYFDDPDFYRAMFKLNKIDKIGGHDYKGKVRLYPSFDIVVDGDEANAKRVPTATLLRAYDTKNKNPNYIWGDNKTERGAIQSTMNTLLNYLKNDNLSPAEKEAIEKQVAFFKKQLSYINYDKKQALNSEDNKKIHKLRDKLAKIQQTAFPKDLSSQERKQLVKKRYSQQSALQQQIDKIEKDGADALKDIPLSKTRKTDNLQNDFDHLSRGFKPVNPIHGEDMTSRFLDKLERKDEIRKKLEKIYKTKDVNSTLTLPKHNKLSLGDSYVNDGVTAMYNTQPISGATMDVYPTNRGMIPLSGTIVEDDLEEGATHDELNSKLFDGEKLKAEVRDALLRIAAVFEDSLDIPYVIEDIYLTGSNVNYNYNDKSDLDLHLVYNLEQAGIAAEILAKYLKTAKKVFNLTYDPTVKGIQVEVGCENIAEPLTTTAIYSLKNDSWIKKSDNAGQVVPDADMEVYNTLVSEIESAIESKDAVVIGELWKKLGELRKQSLAAEGEFGKGNLTFKKLRNMEYLDRLKAAYHNSVSDELSLESLEDFI